MDSTIFPLVGSRSTTGHSTLRADDLAGHPKHRDVWQWLVGGRLSGGVHEECASTFRLSDVEDPGARLSEREARIIERSLAGQAHKMVADAEGISTSYVSFTLGRSLAKLGVYPRAVPLAVIALAQSHAGAVSGLPIDVSVRGSEGAWLVAFEVGRPTPNGPLLTPAEGVVSSLFVDGLSRDEIAVQRRCSYRTIACQLGAVFSTLQVSNRCEMVAAFARRGWFSGSRNSIVSVAAAPVTGIPSGRAA